MLSMTTARHRMFVCIHGISGDSSTSTGGMGEALDAAVDRLLALCQADEGLKRELEEATQAMSAKELIWRHLKEATPEAPWMRSGNIGTSMCSRVLYLMHPNRFGFEKYGWIH